MAQDCLLYFAQKDQLGFPTPSTLQGYNPRVSLPCANEGCDHIEIYPNPIAQPEGTTQCKHPNNLRYFYRVIPYSSPLQVQPNSLIQSYAFPLTPNDCWWREWKKYC